MKNINKKLSDLQVGDVVIYKSSHRTGVVKINRTTKTQICVVLYKNETKFNKESGRETNSGVWDYSEICVPKEGEIEKTLGRIKLSNSIKRLNKLVEKIPNKVLGLTQEDVEKAQVLVEQILALKNIDTSSK